LVVINLFQTHSRKKIPQKMIADMDIEKAEGFLVRRPPILDESGPVKNRNADRTDRSVC
jgi:hypothetical protein